MHVRVLRSQWAWCNGKELHGRSRVRVRTCISYKSLEQPGFYSLIWAHKVRFPEMKFPRIQKNIVRVLQKLFSLNGVYWSVSFIDDNIRII